MLAVHDRGLDEYTLRKLPGATLHVRPVDAAGNTIALPAQFDLFREDGTRSGPLGSCIGPSAAKQEPMPRTRCSTSANWATSRTAGRCAWCPGQTLRYSLPGYDVDGERDARAPAADADIELLVRKRRAQPSAAITGATCASRPSAAPMRCRRSRISAASFAQNVAWPTLRPGRGLLP